MGSLFRYFFRFFNFRVLIGDANPNRYNHLPIGTISLALTSILILLLSRDFAGMGVMPNLQAVREGSGVFRAILALLWHDSFGEWFWSMIILWIFGRRVEDICGPLRFLGLFFLCGLIGLTVEANISVDRQIWSSSYPAVMGIVGGYIVIFPSGKTRFQIFVRRYFSTEFNTYQFHIWAIVTVILLNFCNLISWFISIDSGFGASLIASFISGMLLVFLFMRPDALARYRQKIPI